MPCDPQYSLRITLKLNIYTESTEGHIHSQDIPYTTVSRVIIEMMSMQPKQPCSSILLLNLDECLDPADGRKKTTSWILPHPGSKPRLSINVFQNY